MRTGLLKYILANVHIFGEDNEQLRAFYSYS